MTKNARDLKIVRNCWKWSRKRRCISAQLLLILCGFPASDDTIERVLREAAASYNTSTPNYTFSHNLSQRLGMQLYTMGKWVAAAAALPA